MAYAKLSEVKPGDKLRADGGFTCIAEGEILTVHNNAKIKDSWPGAGLWVHCSHGSHYLDGQTDRDLNTLISLSKI